MPPKKKNRAHGADGAHGAQPSNDQDRKCTPEPSQKRLRLGPAKRRAIYEEIARSPLLEDASQSYRRRAAVIVDLWYNAHWIHPASLVRRK